MRLLISLTTALVIVNSLSVEAKEQGQIRWRTHIPVPIHQGSFNDTVTMIGDSAVCVTSDEGTIYVFSTDGKFLWKKAIDPDGTHLFQKALYTVSDQIYASAGTTLARLDDQGAVKWQVHGLYYLSTAAESAQGTVFVTAEEQAINTDQLRAYGQEGDALWTLDLPGGLCSTPAVHGDKVYVCAGNYLVSATTKGDCLWKRKASDYLIEDWGPAVAPDGIIYVATDTGIHAFDPDGNERWKFLTPGPVTVPIKIDTAGNLSFSSWNGLPRRGYDHVYIVRRSGTAVLDLEVPTKQLGGVVSDGQGAIYFGSGGKVTAMAWNGEKLWEVETGDTKKYTPILSKTGVLYMVNVENELLAIATKDSAE